MIRNEGDRLKRVVGCTPDREYFGPADPAVHNIQRRPDPVRTRAQHDALKALLRSRTPAPVRATSSASVPTK
jgi:hypothetical protein